MELTLVNMNIVRTTIIIRIKRIVGGEVRKDPIFAPVR
jgi:hypothetical protein